MILAGKTVERRGLLRAAGTAWERGPQRSVTVRANCSS